MCASPPPPSAVYEGVASVDSTVRAGRGVQQVQYEMELVVVTTDGGRTQT